MAQLTPMMKQYFEIKNQYKDCILFYRLGDFYEMFYEDAAICSKELELTLTGKNCGQEERAPMCGVPHHSIDSYLEKLIKKGYKVAICEQTEDPKNTKGIVKREVIRVVTPGTNLNTVSLDESKNNYLMGIVYTIDCYGISIVDVTTGDYYVTELDSDRKLLDEIFKFMPMEIVCNDSFFVSGFDIEELKERLGVTITALEASYFNETSCISILKEHFKMPSLSELGLEEYSIGIIASGAILTYLYETQKNTLEHLTKLMPYKVSKFMVLDSSTRRNLELTETMREKQKKGSLLGVLDKTKTAMGARLLRKYLEQPFIEKEEIEKRLCAVEELNQNLMIRDEIREYLSGVYDIERLISKISYRTANPRDLIAFASSLSMLPAIQLLLQEFQTTFLQQLFDSLDLLEDICQLIQKSIVEEPPIAIKEGGIIKEGYHSEIDKFKKAKTDGKTWLSELEARERERTGIKNLRVKYNKVFGYYLEVTNSYQNLVPKEWIRKQTLANAERYTTEELKELENTILGAEDKLYALEYEVFCQIREQIASHVKRVQTSAKVIAAIDVFTCLAFIAQQNNYVKPSINQSGKIEIYGGRHPVVEQMIHNDMFVENDTLLDNGKNRVSIITGPNMAGKSTYMRQTALIVLMAQIGSFVPAKRANIGIVDRIFTRVGASDDLASGQSTFMVEMTEVANILKHATKKSLLILDEIGRGTSTFDGLSIAWAVVEHISNPKLLGAKTLFATHYHELTELEGEIEGVNNYCIAVKEQGDDIVFLRKIVKGGADKSYGIQVAKLAGVPQSVLNRAKEIVTELSEYDIATIKARQVEICGRKQREQNEIEGQLSLFSAQQQSKQSQQQEVIEKIKHASITSMTPIEAMNFLYQLQKLIE